jgi:pimeloyl-ACP methyl ester carboxylesterase
LKTKYRVILFDNRGIGATRAPAAAFDVQTMADDTAALMKALDISSAYILGHSMGTSIALSLAARYPDAVREMVLFNAYMAIRPLAAFTFRTNALLLRQGVSPHSSFRVIMPWLFSHRFFADGDRVDALLAYNETQPLPHTVDDFERQINAAVAFDAAGLLRDVRARATMAAGTYDVLIPPEDARTLAARLPGAAYREVAAGHLSIVESPDQCLEIITW